MKIRSAVPVILGFCAGKSHNLIGLGIFHGDLDFFDLHEKSLDLSNYEIFCIKILKSRTFKKSIIVLKIFLIEPNGQGVDRSLGLFYSYCLITSAYSYFPFHG
jgi:hypothetical protein